MKKLVKFASMMMLTATVVFTACNKDSEDPEPADCAAATYPTTTGDALIKFKNTSIGSGSVTTQDGILSVASGDYITVAVEITKGTARPQKLRVYQTDCENKKGTQLTLDGQPGVSNDGTIDLRNTDAAQVRNVGIDVPTGMSTVYLTFEVDESGGKYTYRRLKLQVSGSGLISQYSGIVLGNQISASPSRLVSGTGQTVLACDVETNKDYIDITYSASTVNANSYLSSNPVRFSSTGPIRLSDNTADGCGDAEDDEVFTDGGNAAYFKVSSLTATQFDDITNETPLQSLTVSSSNDQFVIVSGANTVYEFLNSEGKKGLIKVSAVGTNQVTVAVKVQR